MVYGIDIPDGDKGLTNFDFINDAQKLGINHFRGVFMWDTLHKMMPQGMWNCQSKRNT